MIKPKPGYKLVKWLFGKYKEIPDDWAEKQIKDLAKINPEQIKDGYKYNKIQYVDISSIKNFQIAKLDEYKLNERPSRAQKIIEQNDIIISTVRPYLKSFSLITLNKPNLICSTGFAVVRAKINSDIKFLFNYFKSYLFEVNFIRQMEGMAYPAITSAVVSNSFIFTPAEKTEMEKIGKILSNVDDLIEKCDSIIDSTKKLKTGLMQTLLTKGIGHKKFKKVKWLFGKYLTVPENWNILKVEENTKKIMKGIFDVSPENYVQEGIPFLRISDIGNNDLVLHNCVHITNKLSQKNSNSELYSNDIVLAKVGSIYSNDKISIIPNTISKCNISQNIIGIKTDETKIKSKYLFLELQRNYPILVSFSNATTLGALRLDVLRNLKISVPSLDEQEKITSILSNVDSKISKLDSKKSTLQIIKKGLMQKLLTGQIRVTV